MRQFTTPRYTLLVEGVTINPTDRIFITFSDSFRKKSFNITECEVQNDEAGTYLSFYLTQAQTGLFTKNSCVSVQVNWINNSGVRVATEIKEVPSLENLIKEVIE